MIDFIVKLLPWIFLAGTLVLIGLNFYLTAKKYDETGDKRVLENVGETKKNGMNSSMMLGMCVGIGVSYLAKFSLGIGTTAGLFGGALTWVLIKNRK